MRRMWCRVRAALRRVLDAGARDEELSEELRAFVEHDVESKIRSGMNPEAARRAALIELGGAEQVKERVGWEAGNLTQSTNRALPPSAQHRCAPTGSHRHASVSHTDNVNPIAPIHDSSSHRHRKVRSHQ